jgi:hypothetical protein
VNQQPVANSRVAPQIRRVVLGHNTDGAAVVQFDDTAPAVERVALIWCANSVPVDNERDNTGELHGQLMGHRGAAFFSRVFAPGYVSRMHRTQTLEFGYVISGTIELILADGTATTLNQGDTFVQRGTLHGWRNTTAEPCQLIVASVAAVDRVSNRRASPKS